MPLPAKIQAALSSEGVALFPALENPVIKAKWLGYFAAFAAKGREAGLARSSHWPKNCEKIARPTCKTATMAEMANSVFW
jgi:hypothetical protein